MLDQIITPAQQDIARYIAPALNEATQVYVYGSYNRPLNSIWARIPDTAILDADYQATGYHSYVVAPTPLDEATLERYELVQVFPVTYCLHGFAPDDYEHSEPYLQVLCSEHFRRMVCGHAERTGLRRGERYDHPVYRLTIHDQDRGLYVLVGLDFRAVTQ